MRAPASSPGTASTDAESGAVGEAGVGAVPSMVHDALVSPGQPLDLSLRSYFEPLFGHGFGEVRIHADPAAIRSAKAMRAAAYTVGSSIVFDAHRYPPGSLQGRRLLAHELAHTLQQRGAAKTERPALGSPGDSYEKDAEEVATMVAAGRVFQRSAARVAVQRIQRRTDDEVEATTRVAEGIAAGTMKPVGGVQGETFTANDCFQQRGCSVWFLFEKAYQGTHPPQEFVIGPVQWKGLYVKIVAQTEGGCWDCPALELVQVLRYLKADARGNVVTAAPTTPVREVRAGTRDPQAKSPGWMIDAADTSRDPLYSQSWYGEAGNAKRPAVLWDAPGGLETLRNAGKEFETYLVCVKGNTRVPLASITWGYFVDGSGQISFRPSTPKAGCGSSTELLDAAARWDAIPGNTQLGLGTGKPPQAEGQEK